jgi:cellulose biosynthesis protein BcsQ
VEQCNAELIAQSVICPSTWLSLDMINNSLKEFVRSHQKHWLNQVNYQLTKFKDDNRQQQLWKELPSHLPNVDQVLSERIDRMIAMQEVRLHGIEDMVMFEEQLSR